MTQYAIPNPFYSDPDLGAVWLTITGGFQEEDGQTVLHELCKSMADMPSYPPSRTDNTYVKSPSDQSVAEFWAKAYGALPPFGDPGVSAGNILKIVCRKSIVTDPCNYRIDYELVEGYEEGVSLGTVRASIVINPAPDIFTEYTHELTTDEYNSITDWTDLWFHYAITKC